MPDYSNGCIYIIKSKDVNIKKVYIGSTCNFKRRRCEHKKNCNNSNDRSYNLNVYRYIRDNNGWDEWEMTIIKNFPCNNKKELETEEHKSLLEYGFDNCLNIQHPTRTNKERYEDNKERLSIYQNQYYQNNKDKLKKKMKEYRIDNKEKLKEHHKQYYKNNKERLSEQKKQYYQINKEAIAEQMKQYRINNKEKLNQKFNCDCGGRFTLINKSQHEKSKKHKRHIEQNLP